MANHSDPRLDRFERALSRLPSIERDILLLSAREGLRYAEIASRLNISVDAAKRHLASALDRVGRALRRRS